MPAKATVPVEAFPRTHGFRGHGPLLQEQIHRALRIHGGIYKGPFHCSCSTQAPSRGPGAPDLPPKLSDNRPGLIASGR